MGSAYAEQVEVVYALSSERSIVIWRVNRTTAFRRPISHDVEFSLSNSQIFLIARFAASDKLYRMQKPSISLSINAFRFSSLLII